MINQRIKGTQAQEYAGIKFKSKLEVSCYKKLEQTHFYFKYEPETFILWKGEKINNLYVWCPKKLGPGKYDKFMILKQDKLRNITYTPDFIVTIGNIKAIFDVKGKENDVYPIKKKMFLQYLENLSNVPPLEGLSKIQYIFFEPHNVTQMVQAIELLKIYEEGLYKNN